VPLEKFKVLMDAQDRQSHTKAMHARTSGARRPSPAGWLEGGPVGYPSLQRPSGLTGVPQPPAYFDVERRSMSLRQAAHADCTAIM
jgi:hypothetical protein